MGFLRTLLAILVVIEHCGLSSGTRLLPGNMCVEIFFMISGFYMSLVLSERYGSNRWSEIFDFYRSRFFRLFPGFLLTTAGVYLLYAASYLYLGRPPTDSGSFHQWLGNPVASALIGFSNFLMLGQDIPSLFHVSPHGISLTMGQTTGRLPDGSVWLGYARHIGQAWSIGTEIWFYLLAPFIFRLKTGTLVLLAASILTLRLALEFALGFNPYFIFPLQFPMFVLGALSQRLVPASDSRLLAVAPIAAVLAASLAIGVTGMPQYLKWPIYTVVLIAMPSLFRLSKDSKMDRIVGEQSYPIYISHMLILSALSLGLKRLGLAVNGEILLAATLPLSYLIYRYVDLPVSVWRQRFVLRTASA